MRCWNRVECGTKDTQAHLGPHEAQQVLERYLAWSAKLADALVQALQVWPHEGVPANPQGWLFPARNRAVDLLRREDTLRVKLPALTQLDVATAAQAGDDELALMLLCCHSELPVTSQVVLTLRTVGGLGVNEIAAALLAQPATVAQRLTRAKRWLRSRTDPLELPDAGTLESRVDIVLAVLYLLFNEGYDATTGDVAVRGELCEGAARADIASSGRCAGRGVAAR